MDASPAPALPKDKIPTCVKYKKALHQVVDGKPVNHGHYNTERGSVCIVCYSGKK